MAFQCNRAGTRGQVTASRGDLCECNDWACHALISQWLIERLWQMIFKFFLSFLERRKRNLELALKIYCQSQPVCCSIIFGLCGFGSIYYWSAAFSDHGEKALQGRFKKLPVQARTLMRGHTYRLKRCTDAEKKVCTRTFLQKPRQDAIPIKWAYVWDLCAFIWFIYAG